MKSLLTTLSTLAVLTATGCTDTNVREAQAAPAAVNETSSVFMSAIADDVEGLAAKVTGLAEALSQEQYDWRPGEGVLSAGEVFMHIAAYNYYYPSLAGADISGDVSVTTDYETVGAFEESLSERADVLAALTASFDHLKSEVAKAADADLEAKVEVFGSSSTVQEAWFGTVTHIHEHLGQLIAYARTNGVAPPWSM
ncbi:MAG: DinB family protein [Longimicrobiales bacterium]